MLEPLFEPAFWASVVLLIGMEVALGGDNVVFIANVADRLPPAHRKRVMRIGMALAAVFRLVLLLGVVWVLGLQRTAFTLLGWSPTWEELILIGGGLFLVYKAVTELHLLVEPRDSTEGGDLEISDRPAIAIVQIVLINAVFSVDSIITAIGLTPYVTAMAIAVVVSVGILYFAAEAVRALIERHPSIKALALSFLLMVGVVLVSDGLGLEILRPYLYIAMAFAVLVLGLSKAVRHFSRKGRIGPADPIERDEPRLAATTVSAPEPLVGTLEPEATEPVVAQRVEPTLAPLVEPLSDAEPEETDADAPEMSDVLYPEAGTPVQDQEDHDEPVEPEILGEATSPVQQSRRKRPVKKRAPRRLRTGRRRE